MRGQTKELQFYSIEEYKSKKINPWLNLYLDGYRRIESEVTDHKVAVWRGWNNTQYLVTDNGRVFHYREEFGLGKEIKQYTVRGYKAVGLCSEKGKYKKIYVHRLVAISFIPNQENKAEVNHKDKNKANNCVENLEWVTKSENERHKRQSYKNSPETNKKISDSHKGAKSYRAKKVICIETGQTYETAKEASFSIGRSQNAVSQVCNNGKAIKGLHFKYI